MVTLYVPAANPVSVESVKLFDHKILYGFTPPVTDTPIPPSKPPLQDTLESNRMVVIIDPGSLTIV